jgi:hypothetical protein
LKTGGFIENVHVGRGQAKKALKYVEFSNVRVQRGFLDTFNTLFLLLNCLDAPKTTEHFFEGIAKK